MTMTTIKELIEKSKAAFKPNFFQQIARHVYGVSSKINQWHVDYSLLSRDSIINKTRELTYQYSTVSCWLMGISSLSAKLRSSSHSIDTILANKNQSSEYNKIPGKLVTNNNRAINESLRAKQNFIQRCPKNEQSKDLPYHVLLRQLKDATRRYHELLNHMRTAGTSESRNFNLYKIDGEITNVLNQIETLRVSTPRVTVSKIGAPNYCKESESKFTYTNAFGSVRTLIRSIDDKKAEISRRCEAEVRERMQQIENLAKPYKRF